MLTREAILAMKDLPEKEIEVPEWDGSVRIRSLTLSERFRWLKLQTENEGDYGAVLRLASLPMITWAVIDETGKPLFREEDVAALEQRNPDAIQRLHAEILKISGIGGTDIEVAEKNSEPVQS